MLKFIYLCYIYIEIAPHRSISKIYSKYIYTLMNQHIYLFSLNKSSHQKRIGRNEIKRKKKTKFNIKYNDMFEKPD